MSIFDSFDSPYLKAVDVRPRRRVTIAEYAEEWMGNPKQKKVVVYFEHLNKGLVLNKTNGRALVDAFGRDPAQHLGRVVDLVVARTSYQGEEVDTVRVEIPAEHPPARPSDADVNRQLDAAATANRSPDDDIPF
jgi:hypothetical protein